MAFEDFAEPEVGIAVAVTALATSPKVRSTVRRGLVYGLATLMRAGDALSTAARGAAQTAQQAAASAGNTAQQAAATAGDTVQSARAEAGNGARQTSGKTRARGGAAGE